jgi:hypothetical protein
MGTARRIDGWKLDAAARAELLDRFPPRYPNVIADHVTFKPGPDGAQMPETDHCILAGRADDGEGVEALVVAIAGSTGRPDGSTWHVTWSLAPGRNAVESNEVIAQHGWQPLPGNIPIPLTRSWWMHG